MKFLFALLTPIFFLFLVACAPTATQLKAAIEKDPSIVFVAIEKDPQGFLEIVNKAAREAQQKGQEKSAVEENAARESQYSNPLKPEIDQSRAMLGARDAKVTIVEYTDFECPYCQRGFQTVEQVLNDFPKDVRVLIKHLPLDFHPKAMPAARYYEALRMQSNELALKFYAELFKNQEAMKAKGEVFMKATAKKLGANMNSLAKDMGSQKITDTINADIAEAKKFEISGTPGFVINGVSLKGAYPAEEFKKIIDRHLAKK
jgi:protein-disulfide isomerase